ncbi:L-lactate dehydrogenase complex protein LldG [Bryocella elongata]|uniref:L-lactate dehydrogenase complex protein LldG n=1 Tax=Bryocella elongata TaxID=863522 RepID=A0A1H5T2B4_9BACT|nr:LUD domain-containing protein [Bryocella elongata]SEF56936.1 L-lactate dehydrogenase complex protein LldG [Bryocella elongata]
MTAREEILARIQGALHVRASDPANGHGKIERTYTRTTSMNEHETIELFIDRLVDYDTEVIQVASDSEIAGAVAQSMTKAQETALLAPAGFPQEWLPTSIAITLDENLSHVTLDAEKTVITTCEAAVASTGTIFLVHGGTQGRRVITLLPDHHICIVRRSQVYSVLPEALAAVTANATKPITTISGPSATSDIEMVRIRGVHGPRSLTVILVS